MTQTMTQPDVAESEQDADPAERANLPGGYHHRSLPLVDFEFRAKDGDETWTFDGIACTVDHAYFVRDQLGEYMETIAAGAANRSINDPPAKISLYTNHGHGKSNPLAVRSRSANTLEVVANPHIRFRAKLDPRRADVQILRSNLDRGEMNEMSIGFGDVAGGWEWTRAYSERVVKDMRLREGSIVEDGCNELTYGSIRSLAAELARFNHTNIDEQEVQRAIGWLQGLLPQTETVEQAAEVVAETVERSGLVVTDEFIQLWQKRQLAAA
jgi:HK97 family phage prohead protease